MKTETAKEQKTSEMLARLLYQVYCKGVGGKAFNGAPLPGWKEFQYDRDKVKQCDAWISVGRVVKKWLRREMTETLKLQAAIQKVIVDEEFAPGSWGPDVTTLNFLKKALEDSKLSSIVLNRPESSPQPLPETQATATDPNQ